MDRKQITHSGLEYDILDEPIVDILVLARSRRVHLRESRFILFDLDPQGYPKLIGTSPLLHPMPRRLAA